MGIGPYEGVRFNRVNNNLRDKVTVKGGILCYNPTIKKSEGENEYAYHQRH